MKKITSEVSNSPGKAQWHYGVSPAWFISRFGEGFSMAQMASELPAIHSLGFRSWQPEAYGKEDLESWIPPEIANLNSVQAQLGLVPSQCVAHFLLKDFASSEALQTQAGLPFFRELVNRAAGIEGLTTICFPLSEFSAEAGQDFMFAYESLVAYVSQLLNLTRNGGFDLTVEIMPGGLVQGTEGFLRLWKDLGSPEDLGYCLDSGHVWGGREHIVSIPQRLGRLLKTTHLGDHDGSNLIKMAPGTGTVPFLNLLKEMKRSGYEGNLDIEFVCEPQKVEGEYRRGLEYLKSIVANN